MKDEWILEHWVQPGETVDYGVYYTLKKII